MVSIKKTIKNILIGIGLTILMIFVYSFLLGNQKGISFNCETKEIEGFRTIPPPLMSTYQPEVCVVTFLATLVENETHICGGEYKIRNYVRGILPCRDIKNYANKEINVTAIFADLEGDVFGKTSKILTFRD